MLVFSRLLQFTLLYGGCTYLCYAPFRRKLRFSSWKVIFFLTVIFTIYFTVYVSMLVFVSKIASLICFYVSLVACGMFYTWSVDESPYKSFLIFLLVACYGAFVCGCSILISNAVCEKGIAYEILYTIALLLIGGVTFLGIYRFLAESIVPTINSADVNDIKFACFMPLFYLVIQMIFFACYDSLEQMSNLVYLIVLIALNLSTYFVIRDILHILNHTADKMRMQKELSTAEKLLELQKSQYASWVAQIEEVRRARHDLKHHIAIIQSFIVNDDRDELHKYIKVFERLLPESAPMMLCQNMDVNAILVHYYERAKKEQIKFEIVADVGEDISIHSQDLAVVFGNCLENAFEACARMDPSSEKAVTLMAKPVGNGLAVIIDNTFHGQITKENDVFLSSKRQNQAGIGMASVKLIAQKYVGIVSFETEGDLFMTSIRLGGKAAVMEESDYGK